MSPTALYLGHDAFSDRGTAGDIWIDDVALGDKQICCQ